MDVHTLPLLQDIGICEGHARTLREKLAEDPKLGLEFTNDYSDTPTLKSQLHQGKAILHRIRAFSEAVRSLLRYAELAIYKIEDAMKPLALHDGLETLPDDILASIFEETVEFEDQQATKTSTLTLASVNRRFRSVALRIPMLWSVLPYNKEMEAFRPFLDRSGNVALTVFLGHGIPRWYKERVLFLKHRWGSVVVHIPDDGNFMLPDDSIHFPRLEVLRVEHSGELSPVDLRWTAPALRHLSVLNIIPTLRQDTSAFITSFEFKLESLRPYRTLPSFLHPPSLMRNLQYLSLSFTCIASILNEDSSLCSLQTLTRLRLELLGQPDIPNTFTIKLFLDKIIMKNVRKIEVLAKCLNADVLYKCTKDIFRCSSRWHWNPELRFPALEEATVTSVAEGGRERSGQISPDDLLEHPEIKHLHINAPVLYLPNNYSVKKHNLDIRTVAIVGCKSGAREFLDHLLLHVNPDGSTLCSRLETVKIFGCPEVTWCYLMNHLPLEKIIWSPIVDGESSYT